MSSELPADVAPEFFATMVESVGVGVGIYGADGRYVYVNEAYASLFGASTAELIDTPLWDVVDDIEADRFESYWNSFEEGETRTAESVHSYGGEGVPVGTVTTRRTIDGTAYHFGTIKDISERKAREKELRRQNERLENFASIVSHDLRNPLNVAQGYIDLLREDVDRDELRLVDNALDRMDVLIRELLELAQGGDQVGEAEPVALCAAAEDAWETVSTPRATLHPPSSTVTVLADQTRLQQLFENLFRNAVEHGGQDVVVTVGVTDEGFYVADDGVGIPADRREQVFETGYTTSEQGTGFGLGIVQQIASGHGWEVRLSESVDGGARFDVVGVSFTDR
ncbi:sensor box histidine kinase [Natronomonas pharaonis DSM 2160]|uniref:histidine kinase n=1 Tax=Natronomonas pharaonis (strain ATCC 35678 / DSM 2160 / CIP 103997 / JCM 8858 / NBRC 14720 / NCIMB 2260 / Gabara) TaxID=348780 RepID=A0A1U7EVH2_NATPD|nr:PAS domain-containing sensor histidine kinase [Natronomonas pharaonis]CAI49016.1 sensor box histidine kinase [Natronomonas pharaonis DSM 2160]